MFYNYYYRISRIRHVGIAGCMKLNTSGDLMFVPNFVKINFIPKQ